MIAQLPHVERVRALTQPSADLLKAANKQHVTLVKDPVSADGRLELRFYFREQAVTETQHRYGNIISAPQ